MKIFITGGTGFIGSHLVERLVSTEHELICQARDTSNVLRLKDLGVKIVTGDLTDKNSLLSGMQGCNWVINLANIYSFWEPDKKIYAKINVDGNRNVMESALEMGVEKVIHISTGGIYGKPEEVPFKEESSIGPVRFSDYFESKYQGDIVAWDMYKNKGLPLVVIYPCAVLGPGDPKASGKYLKDLINRRLPATILHESILTWVHVKDVAEVIIRAAEKKNNIGEKYLVGKFQMSLKEINQLASEISGVPLPKLHLPDFIVVFNSILLTWLSGITRKPPMLGLSRDKIRVMKEGFRVDGSKVERELGLTYTTIRIAVEEAIASYQKES